MDPNANLAEQLELAREIQAIKDQCGDDGEYTEDLELAIVEAGERLADLVLALNGWLTSGGFPPTRWAVMT